MSQSPPIKYDPEVRPLYGFAYCLEQEEWVEQFKLKKQKCHCPPSSSISLVTYNVWFSQRYFEIRVPELLSEIRKTNCDIICLQEVTPRFVELLRQQSWIKESYYLSDITGDTVFPYGLLLLSKIPFSSLSLITLPTNMDRKVLLADFTPPTLPPFSVATVHLESLSYDWKRKQQLQVLASLFSSRPNILLAGDFNFDDKRNFVEGGPLENDNLSLIFPDFVDVWEVVGEGDGFSFDTLLNGMVGGRKVERMRYDRVILRGDWSAKEMKVIGKEAVDDERKIWPSDHFGLFTCISADQDACAGQIVYKSNDSD